MTMQAAFRDPRTELALNFRWLIHRDLPTVLAIEQACFADPWTEGKFVRHLRQRNCIGMVCEADDLIMGFALYELEKHALRLLNFAVDPRVHRMGIGSYMVSRLACKLSTGKREKLSLCIRETNLPGQLFWRAMGARCVMVVREPFDDTSEDGYEFEFRIPAPAPSQPDSHPHLSGSRRGI